MIIEETNMLEIIGGASNISGAVVNAIVKLVTTLFDIGKSIGTAINMAANGKKC